MENKELDFINLNYSLMDVSKIIEDLYELEYSCLRSENYLEVGLDYNTEGIKDFLNFQFIAQKYM